MTKEQFEIAKKFVDQLLSDPEAIELVKAILLVGIEGFIDQTAEDIEDLTYEGFRRRAWEQWFIKVPESLGYR